MLHTTRQGNPGPNSVNLIPRNSAGLQGFPLAAVTSRGRTVKGDKDNSENLPRSFRGEVKRRLRVLLKEVKHVWKTRWPPLAWQM